MSAGIWFWLFCVFCVVFGLFCNWPLESKPAACRPLGWSLVVLVLLGLLGWGVFSPPIR